MLSIGKAQGSYYANLAQDDYYSKGGEKPGLWHGDGRFALRVWGTVNKDQFLRMCDGFSSDGREKLVQNAGSDNHRAGWDLTYSAPKSVSTLWALADDATRKQIEKAHLEAVKEAINYLEKEGAYARRGAKGDELEKCKLIVALYEHGTSRAQDPQLHTHAVVLNIGIRADGTSASLQSQHLYTHKMAAGAIYRTQLAANLQKALGVELEAGKANTFEVKHVSKTLCDEFSTRRAEIEKAMEAEGAKGAARAAYFTLTTREKKGHVAREILFEGWAKTGKEHGFDYRAALNRQEHQIDKERMAIASLQTAVSKITESQAYFTKKDLVRRVAEAGQANGIEAKEVFRVVDKYLDHEAIHLRTREGEKVYTTREIDALEKRMLAQVEAGREKQFQPLSGKSGVLKADLSDEQKRAVLDITNEKGSIKVVNGMAGAGKTTMLKAAREKWEEQGFTVIGASLAAVAAKNLEDEAGIKSATVAKLLYQIDQDKQEGNPQNLKYGNNEIRITAKSVLVVDEAGMIGTPQMARLIDETEKKGARLVLVGDAKQLQPIEHGGPFRVIGDIVGKSELNDIRRQRAEWAKKAVTDFAHGNATEGLSEYARQGLLKVEDTRRQAVRVLVKDWAADETKLQDKLILTTTKESVKELNRLSQDERRKAGELGSVGIEFNRQAYFENDRILFTKNRKSFGVNNGDIGTIKRVDLETGNLFVKLDRGGYVNVNTAVYKDFDLGYAVTTHKAQGKTVEKAYVLAGGSMQDRELSYVQVSRSRDTTRLYMGADDVGQTVSDIAKMMSRSRQKEIAQEQRTIKVKIEQRRDDQSQEHERERRYDRGISR